MVINTSKKDYMWSFASYLLKFGINVFLLPLVLSVLTTEEYGLWVTFASISTLVNLFDFGFSSTILRNLTYVWSGAKKLQKQGMTEFINDDRDDRLFVATYASSKMIYRIVAIASLFVSITIGTIYIIYIIKDIFQIKYIIAWIIYSISITLNLYFCYCTVSLKSIGAISESQQAIVIGFVAQFLISAIGLILGGGILALSCAGCVGGIITRLLSERFFKRQHNIGTIINKYTSDISKEEKRNMLGIIWYNAKKAGVSSIATVMLTQGTTILCSAYLGISETASYGICLQLLSAISGVGQIFFQTSIPKLTQMKQSQNIENSRNLFSASLFASWVIFFVGCASLLLFGNNLLHIIGSNTTIDYLVFVLMACYTFGEMNYSMNASYISLGNTLPFVKSVVITSIGCIIISLIGLSLFKSIIVLLGIRIVCESVYIFWKWPYVAQKELSLGPLKIILRGAAYFKRMLFGSRNKSGTETVSADENT